jgi:hypothetical protein
MYLITQTYTAPPTVKSDTWAHLQTSLALCKHLGLATHPSLSRLLLTCQMKSRP